MRRSITIFVPAGTSARETYQYDRFADDLRLHTTSPVGIVDTLRALPDGNGLILVHQLAGLAPLFADFERSLPKGLTDRVMLLQAGPETLEEGLLRYRLAGCVGPAPWLHWAEGRWPDGGRCELWGLRSIARQLGAATDPRFRDPRYALLGNVPSLDLPALISAYLDRYKALLAADPWPG